MADLIDRVLSLPDQIFKVIVDQPPWLQMWVYALIVLNFITIAGVIVSNLVLKQTHRRQTSLESFSIESPRDGEEIGLGEDRGWRIAGSFPVDVEDPTNPAKMTIDVLEIPGGRILQDENPIFDNVHGRWHDDVRFPGNGKFKIRATVFRGGLQADQEVQVNCTDKATAIRNRVEKDRISRGVPSQIPRQEISLSQRKALLYELQNQFFKQYTDNNLDDALATIFKALELIDPALPNFPNDLDLQNFRAYFLKNYAMIMRDQNRAADAAWALDGAAIMFGAIHQQNPKDPSALNGLGSVAILRGDYRAALSYIDEALKIEPHYEAALHDQKLATDLLREQEKQAEQKNIEPRQH